MHHGAQCGGHAARRRATSTTCGALAATAGTRSASAALGGRHDVGRRGAGASARDGHVGPRGGRGRGRPRGAHARDLPRALAFDMGGTTTDVCLIADGVPETARAAQARRRTRCGCPAWPWSPSARAAARSPGSTATGALKVGPRSAGAVPGPACYGLGGTEPTVTDANLILGYLNPERIYGGSIRLDRAAAPRRRSRRSRRSASASRSSRPPTAWWRSPTRACCARCGWSPCSAATICASFALIAYGGAGPLHAGALAREAGDARAWSSPRTPARSRRSAAWSRRCATTRCRPTACASTRWDREGRRGPLPRARGAVPGPAARRRAIPLERDDRDAQRSTCATPARTTSSRCPTAAATRAALRAAFEHRHRQLYGYATGESVECVNLRVAARGVAGRRAAASRRDGAAGGRAAVGEHRAFFPRRRATSTLPRYDRAALPAGVTHRRPSADRGRVVHDPRRIRASAAAADRLRQPDHRGRSVSAARAGSRHARGRPQRALRHRRGDERHRHALGALAAPQGGGRSLLGADRRARAA